MKSRCKNCFHKLYSDKPLDVEANLHLHTCGSCICDIAYTNNPLCIRYKDSDISQEELRRICLFKALRGVLPYNNTLLISCCTPEQIYNSGYKILEFLPLKNAFKVRRRGL